MTLPVDKNPYVVTDDVLTPVDAVDVEPAVLPSAPIYAEHVDFPSVAESPFVTLGEPTLTMLDVPTLIPVISQWF